MKAALTYSEQQDNLIQPVMVGMDAFVPKYKILPGERAFYERRKVKAGKRAPFFVRRRNDADEDPPSILLLAGIYEESASEPQETTFAVFTKEPPPHLTSVLCRVPDERARSRGPVVSTPLGK
ncbi:uncharacterized protein LOC144157814 [Haemaphysalis longicornis]